MGRRFLHPRRGPFPLTLTALQTILGASTNP